MMSATVGSSKAAHGAAKGLGWAVFWCGFVPGLLQYRLGQKVRAAVALASCTVVFLVGWTMVRERLFYFALIVPEEGVRGAGVLTQLSYWCTRIGLAPTLPEVLNAPANALGSWLAFSTDFESQRLWRLPRAGEHLGGFLTAASGMLAAFWSADAHWSLRRRRDGNESTPNPQCNPALAAGVSWLLPGLGHWLAGQRGKGTAMGFAVLAVFAVGLAASEGHAVDRAVASVWWIGQSLCGGGALFAALVTAPWQMGSEFPEHLELGTNLCTVAGLMNLVVMVDAFTVAERQALPVRDAQGGSA